MTVRSRRSRERFAPLVAVGAGFFLQGLTAVTGVISARLLGVTGRGEIALVAAISGVACMLGFGGLPNAIARTLAERGLAARDVVSPLVRRWSITSIAPVVLATGYLLAALPHTHRSHLLVLAVLGGALTWLLIVFRIALGCLQGEGRVGRLVFAGIAPQLLLTIGLVALWVGSRRADAITVALVMAVSNVLAVGITLRALRPRSAVQVEPLDGAELSRESRRSFLSSVGVVDGLGADRILVGSVIGAASLGLYSAATAVANLSSLAGAALGYILLPKVAASQSPEGDRRAVLQWTLFALATTTLIVVGLEIAVGPIIRLAFGTDFVPAVPAARWLVLADGLLGFRRVLIAILQGRGRAGTASRIELWVAIATLAGLLVACVSHDLERVGQVMAAAGVATLLLLSRQVLRPGAPSSPPAPAP